jgi:hypothetical protein
MNHGYGPTPSPFNADVLHHDQGPDGTTHDTGYMLFDFPSDNVEETYCEKYTAFWFDETVTAQDDTLRNIYFHNWWSLDTDNMEFGYGKTRTGLYNTLNREQYFSVYNSSEKSNISYDDKIYHLEASLMDISNPLSFGDNDIYEFFIQHFADYGDDPSIINNRSILSFVIFNIPDNVTLQGLDSDVDGLNDYTELFATFTSPFVADTDNDGVSDYFEYLSGSDPNDYSDTTPPESGPSYKISIGDGWNLVSIPVNNPVSKYDVVVSYLGFNYSWQDAVDGGIVVDFMYEWFDGSYLFADVLNPGFGYWMFAYFDCDLWVSSIINDDTDDISDLFVGWNLIGLPFNETIYKDDLLVFYNGSNHSWQDAVDEDIILEDIYEWKDNIQYDFTDILYAGKGYWMYVYENCVLRRT